VDVVELQRSSVTTEASKIGFVGDKQILYARLIAVLIGQGRTAEAFDYLERCKSRALVDMLASKKDFSLPAGDATQIRELLVKVEQVEMEAPNTADASVALPGESAAPPSAEPSGQRNLGISAARRAGAAIPAEVASLVSVSSTSIEEIQARIPTDEVLIEYYFDEKSLFIFLLSQQGLQMLRSDAGSLIADARAFRDAIESPESDAYLIPAQRLYKQLVLPIEPQLAGRSKLIIVPHGVLHYVPFAALHDGRGFLIDKYAFRVLPSASVIKYLRGKHAPKAGGILAFGNPDLGDPRYDLKFAEDEARAIVKTVPASRVLVRGEATEAALRDNAAGFTYLHFATHGQFNADHPLESALILAKDSSSDGYLTVNKLYSMHLDTDLATLSACETGLGKIANGDDVVGLTRGFLFAGASTVVASLWQVDDQATSTLMSLFYEKLKDNDKRESLREAQIDTRRTFPHPYYWAGFQLTGNAI
jgi:CHAT domain-containing protein